MDWAYLMGLYRHYQNGHLFVAGGVANQPDLYMEVMRLIDQWVAKFSEKT